jgi:L-ascorbate metabolism protein UlaG (beta-lactamase superfamily)
MKITKLVHSCILVEQDGKKLLADPGMFSWQSGVIVDQSILRDIDYVVITHGHADHYHSDFASVVNELSPNAIWYAPQEVVDKLSDQGIKAFSASELSDVVFVESDHADLDPWNTQPEHTSYLVFNELLISGDCQTHTEMYGARILAGALNGGPWGAVVGELKMLQALKDKSSIYTTSRLALA